jgi:uncharacterized protein YdcH (DUF465 family)
MSEKPTNLRVSRLTERDFMRIDALDVIPGEKSLVVLRGPNKQGKTSAIRGLVAALGGKSFDPDEPIKQGAENGSTEVVLADKIADRLRVRVSYTPKGRYLTVHQIEGGEESKVTAAQGFLNELIGTLTYDPLEFMRSKPAEQLKMLMEAVGALATYNELRTRRKAMFDERAELNRRVKDYKARLKAEPDPAPGENLERKSAENITEELGRAQEHNHKVESAIRRYEEYVRVTESKQKDLAALKKQVIQLEAEIEERLAKQKEASERVKNAKRIETFEISEMMTKIAEHNAKCEQQERYRNTEQAMKSVEHAAKNKTDGMAAIDGEVGSILSESDLAQSIPGLVVTSDGSIEHNGVPVSQASGMEQLELSCSIAMATNPSLRVMCIDEGDRLDPDAIARLKAIAEKNDCQVWMTAVYAGGSDDEHVVELDNGRAKGAPPPVDPNLGVEEMYSGPNNERLGKIIDTTDEVDLPDDDLSDLQL